ncbi:uncharacterized protein LOC135827055 [Sycon ciliatum]|uniref:uncharacterized protein LOC135827055 n=1 Tax=Sycon ciliatum TaxID=27933 RepID=UPI0031F675BA
MDDVKLMAATSKQLNSMINIVSCVGKSIGMELSPAKCAKLVCPHGAVDPDQPATVTLDQASSIASLADGSVYAYLGIRECFGMAEQSVKVATTKEFRRRLRLVTHTSLNACNLSRAINSYVIPELSYGLCIVPWTKDAIATFDRNVRSALRAVGAHHPRSSTIRFHLPRSEGGRGIVSVEHLLERKYTRLSRYLQAHSDLPLIAALHAHHENLPPTKSIISRAATAMEHFNILDIGGATTDVVKSAIRTSTQASLRQKPLHGRYWQRSGGVLDMPLSFNFLKSPTLRPSTESSVFAAQDQVVNTRNYQRSVIGDTSVVGVCRLCGGPGETVDHILACCPVLARTAYITRHNRLAAIVYRALCHRYRLVSPAPPGHLPHYVEDSEGRKLMWEMPIPTDRMVGANRPDLVWDDGKSVQLIDVSVPLDHRVTLKHAEKRAKYLPLAVEIGQIWQREAVSIVPIIVGALGGLTKEAATSIKQLCGEERHLHELQQAAILGSMAILRSVLGAA